MADDDINPHEWEKPAWAKDGPKLKSTGKAEIMKAQGNLAGEITMINKNKDESRDINPVAKDAKLAGAAADGDKDLSWEKPAWTQNAGLKSTTKGEKMKTKGDLAKPITFPKGK
jgi:hypothetical protein